MSDPTSWATIAMVGALGLEKLANRCNWYPPQGVKAVDCASKCFTFHVERSSGPTTPATVQSGAHSPPMLSTTPSNELRDFVAATARRLSTTAPIPEELMSTPTVQRTG